MKLSPAQFRNLSKSTLSSNRSALFYAEDASFALEKVQSFFKALGLSSEQISTVEASKLLSKDVLLNDLSGTANLWGDDEKKAIWIQSATDRILPLVKDYVADAHALFVVITTEKYLKPASKLRKHFEAESNLLSMGCFAPTPQEVSAKIQEHLQKEGKQLEPRLLQHLGLLFSSNASMVETELEKLITYVGNRTPIEESDIKACIALPTSVAYDDLFLSLLNKNPQKAIDTFREHIKDGTASIGILRGLLAQVRRLYALKKFQKEGKTFDAAAMSVSPPVFYNQKETIRQILTHWSASALQKLMLILEDSEIQNKTHAPLANILSERSLVRGIYIREKD